MTPMCDTTTGELVGWAIGSTDCDGSTISLEYFDEDGVTAGTTLPAGWKPCVQGLDGPVWTPAYSALTYAAIVNIDFAGAEFQEIALTGNLELTGSNYVSPSQIKVILRADASTRTLTFPAGWVFVGTAPANIAADKTGVLTLISTGVVEADVVASWEVEA